MIVSLKQKKIKFKPRIKLNHNVHSQPYVFLLLLLFSLCKTNGTEIQRKDISFLLSKTKDAFAVLKAMAPCSKLIFRKYIVPIGFIIINVHKIDTVVILCWLKSLILKKQTMVRICVSCITKHPALFYFMRLRAPQGNRTRATVPDWY